jgi:hypothetical protein
VTDKQDGGSSGTPTETADETSSLAVEEHWYLTDEVISFRTSLGMPSLRHTHEARACGPLGHKYANCCRACQRMLFSCRGGLCLTYRPNGVAQARRCAWGERAIPRQVRDVVRHYFYQQMPGMSDSDSVALLSPGGLDGTGKLVVPSFMAQ